MKNAAFGLPGTSSAYAQTAGYRALPCSVGELGYLMRSLGMTWDSFMQSASIMDADDIGALFEMLRASTLGKRADTTRFLFYLDLARSVFPHSRLQGWAQLMRDVWAEGTLSESTLAFLDSERIEETLWEMLVRRSGTEPLRRVTFRDHRVASIRGLLSALEAWDSLVAEDPNLGLLTQIVDRYVSLQEYYAHHDVPRRVVERMVELGFDVDHLVFGGGEILPLGGGREKPEAPWHERLRALTREILGNGESPGAVDLKIDRARFFHQIRNDYECLATRPDPASGVRLIDALVPKLEDREIQIFRSGDLISEARLGEYLFELRSLRRTLIGTPMAIQPAIQPRRRIRAIRSRKSYPELLFDNVRLSCCLFKPAGMFHTEISRLLLDPATPLIEFWADPHPEFLGLATLYAGANARGERTILMDTVDYGDELLDVHGYNPTMEYMLGAMVADAYLAKAEKLVVFAAPYGKPVNFANFVRRRERQHESIAYHAEYYFEGVDPSDGALLHSRTGRHHYTAALGYGRPLYGVIDFGFNLVAPGRVDKLMSGGSGVYEIDVAGYLAETGLLEQPRPSPAVVSGPIVRAIHRRPSHHQAEVEARTESALRRATARLRRIVDAPSMTWSMGVDAPLIADLVRLEESTFAEHFRYSENDFRRRLLRKSARVLVLAEGGTPIAHVLSYAGLEPLEDELYIDEIAVHPTHQRRGVGSELLQVMSELAAIAGWRRLALCAPLAHESPRHARFYARAGFSAGEATGAMGQRYVKRLSMLDHPEVHGILERVEAEISRGTAVPKVTLHRVPEPTLLDAFHDLERAFPDRLRYTAAEFRERFSYPDAYAAMFWDREQPIGFSLSYHIPHLQMAFPPLPRHGFFLDTIAIRPEYQSKGLGSSMMRLLLAIPSSGQYTSLVLFCRADWNGTRGLVPYYERFGAHIIDTRDGWARMVIPIMQEHDTQKSSPAGRPARSPAE